MKTSDSGDRLRVSVSNLRTDEAARFEALV